MFDYDQFRQEMEMKAEKLTPHLPAFGKSLKSFQEKKSLWKRVLLIGTPIAGTALAAATALGVTLAKPLPFSPSYRLTYPAARAHNPAASSVRTIKQSTYDLYESFLKNVAPLVLKDKFAASVSFSIPDAFVNFCIEAYCAQGAAQKEYLAVLNADSLAEVNEAAREIILALGTEFGSDDTTFGGYSVSSLWIGEDLPLQDDLTEKLSDLAKYYYCSFFHHAPTTDLVNKFFASDLPDGVKEAPSVTVPEDSPTASASAYYCFDHYSPEVANSYRSQYLSGNHKMDYTLPDGTAKKIDYVGGVVGYGAKYVGASFVGSSIPLNNLAIAYFLPDRGVDPSAIVADVIRGNYVSEDADPASAESYGHDWEVTYSAPYFKIQSSLNLMAAYASLLPTATSPLSGGLFSGIVDYSKLSNPIYLSQAFSISEVTYDYNGFYSASINLGFGAAGGPVNRRFSLILDHPYVYVAEMPGMSIEGTNASFSLPMIYGEILDPNYAGH